MKPRLTKHGDYERRTSFHAFGYAVFVIFTEDMARSVHARYPKMPYGDSFRAIHCHEHGNPYSHVFFKIGDCPPGTVAHECWHAVRFMLLDWAGCNLDSENIAYHLGYVVDAVHTLRNDLIDNGVGVKSKVQEAQDDNGLVGKRSEQSRFVRASEGEEVLQTETHRASDSGRCCP